MELTDALVLPGDVTVVPSHELRDDERLRLELDDGDYVITRPRIRSGSKVVDAATADLLQRFREPRLLVDVVIDLARESDEDPERLLEDAFEVTRRLAHDRLLVTAGAELADAIEQTLAAGDTVDGVRIDGAIQVVEDTEVYRAETADGTPVALKLARTPSAAVAAMHDREAAALERLAALPQVLPLIGRGTYQERPYVLTGWQSGTPLGRWIHALGGRFDEAADARRRRLAAGIASLYATIHAHGVRHGDVHPGNVLVDAQDEPHLLDFGLATVEGEVEHRVRGAVAQFIDPEYARARRAGKRPPVIDERAEQYAVAALCYLTLTGGRHLGLPPDKQRLYETIAEQPPQPMATHSRPPLPCAEACVARALSPDRDDRHPSMRAFADELGAALEDDPFVVPSVPSASLDDVVDSFLAMVGLDGPLISTGVTTAPRASLNFGSAGVALGVLRIAHVRDAPELLALADVWVELARAAAGAPDAFYDGDVTETSVGRTGLLHTRAGVHYAGALVAHARSDFVGMNREVGAFVKAADGEHHGHDFALGRAGLLFAAAQLLELAGDDALVDGRPLERLGGALHSSIWEELDALPEIRQQRSVPYLGAAHGWAGILHATAAWHSRAGSELPASFHARLDELVALADGFDDGPPWGRLASSKRGSPDRMSGWCNGTAGMILTLAAIGRQLGRGDLVDVAVRAGEAMQAAGDRTGTLCCGIPGEIYAFLSLARSTADPRWAAAALDLAGSTAREIRTMEGAHLSLFKGLAGTVAALADATDPQAARMPAYEM